VWPPHSETKTGGADWKPSTDIYGDDSWPDIDGVDVWDMLLHPESYHRYSAHESLLLSREVLLRKGYKIMTRQRGHTYQPWDPFEDGWREANGTWTRPSEPTCGQVWGKHNGPCLFDLEADPREQKDLSSSMPQLLDDMQKELDEAWKTFYVARSPANLMGPCDATCANAKWESFGGSSGHGPVCGVPGCSGAFELTV
jgi:hypothetical protein